MTEMRRGARTVLVTGASSGIGRAAARLFAERGARVFGTSRSARPDDAGVEMLRLDVRREDSVRQCVEEVRARAGGIDILVNNAGVMLEGFAEETTPDEAETAFATNFFGTVRVTNAVLPGMRERRSGRIVNVGSLAAWVGEPGEGFYAASKAALARYSEALRQEVWHLGVGVVLVEPGAFTTDVLNAAKTAGAVIADYDGPRESAHRTLHRAMARGQDPRVAAEVIWKAATDRRPRGRYGAGREGFWVPRSKTLLPQRLFERLLRGAYRLPR
ncbi:SDR family NAD(P)-dependent oxidoreductase [Streptomyces sediminimaris]|uniref:SDR family NAD(P)-dependent oxidoreductase n=1 Tax=Streptomyces sediminimaris TaxID=3383721 RepID=UPI00399B1A87